MPDRFAGPRLGIDLGGTTMKVVITGPDDRVLAVKEGLTGDHRQVEAVLARLLAQVEKALVSAGLGKQDLVAAGIGLPGEIELAQGLFRSSPIFPSWNNVPVKEILSGRLGLPVAIENDANATLIGEFNFGAARGADPVALLTVGTGIGGAVLNAGQLVQGAHGSAGELGHLCVDPQGPQCWCGARGCLGLLASTSALLENYRQKAVASAAQEIDGRLFARQYRAGEPAAEQALAQMAMYLARGIMDMACVLAPQKVILCGGIMSELARPLIERIRQSFAGRHYPKGVAELDITAAELGAIAGALGASLLIPENAESAAADDLP